MKGREGGEGKRRPHPYLIILREGVSLGCDPEEILLLDGRKKKGEIFLIRHKKNPQNKNKNPDRGEREGHLFSWKRILAFSIAGRDGDARLLPSTCG